MNTWRSKVSGYFTVANCITASRIIFFGICIEEAASSRPLSAIIFFSIAWGLDAIDGTIARWMHQESIFGSQLDKFIDRIILVGTVVFLIRYEYLPSSATFLLVKDIGLSVALSAKKKGAPFPPAGWQGKALSVMQGVGILWLFAGMPGQVFVVTFVALCGGWVAVDYLRKL